MAVFELEKKKLPAFLTAVMQDNELIAPVKTDLVRYTQIDDSSRLEEIYLKENSFFPAKEFFFKKREVLLVWDGKKISAPIEKPRKRVFFGMRRCDLNGILRQDIAFIHNAPTDPYYKAQRDGSILIGYHCNEAPSKYCFCGSLELKEFFDLMFFDRGDKFFVETGSEKGIAFAAKYGRFFGQSNQLITHKDRKIKGADRLETKDFTAIYDNPGWKKAVDMCISCGACTTLCPTCYCHECHDEVPLDGKKQAKRVRTWSSCQVTDFTKVAGDHVFRKDREARFKHRIYHQLEYFREKNGIDLCVGCGRCIEGCPTKIDFVQHANQMSKTK